MIKTTIWKPDTCGCEIHYQWDTESSEENRTHTVSHTVTCAEHSGLQSHQDVFDSVSSENTLKNNVIGQLLKKQELTEGSRDERVFKKGCEPEWKFDQNRKLSVKITGVDPILAASISDDLLQEYDITVENGG